MDPNFLDALMARLDQTLTDLFEDINQRMDQMERTLNDRINDLGQPNRGHERNGSDNEDPSIKTNESDFEEPNVRNVAQQPAHTRNWVPHEINQVRERRHHDYLEQGHEDDDYVMRNVWVEFPSFDGSLDPAVYLDWETSMDQYWDNMIKLF